MFSIFFVSYPTGDCGYSMGLSRKAGTNTEPNYNVSCCDRKHIFYQKLSKEKSVRNNTQGFLTSAKV